MTSKAVYKSFQSKGMAFFFMIFAALGETPIPHTKQFTFYRNCTKYDHGKKLMSRKPSQLSEKSFDFSYTQHAITGSET